MNIDAFKKAYNESRNGTNQFHYAKLLPNFLYSDGMKECAEAGCYWLLSLLGSELPNEFDKRTDDYLCVITLKVNGGKAVILGEWQDNDPMPYTKVIHITDMPDGDWKFFVSESDGNRLLCILPSEY